MECGSGRRRTAFAAAEGPQEKRTQHRRGAPAQSSPATARSCAAGAGPQAHTGPELPHAPRRSECLHARIWAQHAVGRTGASILQVRSSLPDVCRCGRDVVRGRGYANPGDGADVSGSAGAEGVWSGVSETSWGVNSTARTMTSAGPYPPTARPIRRSGKLRSRRALNVVVRVRFSERPSHEAQVWKHQACNMINTHPEMIPEIPATIQIRPCSS